MILPRRKLLKAAAGLIAAPYVAKAAFFQGAINGPSGIIMGQQKPTGTPTYVGSALFPGMIFYAFDTGTGAGGTDVFSAPLSTSSNLAINPTAYNSPGSPCFAPTMCPGNAYDPDIGLTGPGTPSGGIYGTGMHWTGLTPSQQPGTAVLFGSQASAGSFPNSDPMASAINLVSRLTAGDTFIMFATFIQDADMSSVGGLICGRSALPDSLYWINAFTIGGTTTNKVSFNWLSDPTPGSPNSVTSSSTHTRNDLHTVVATCVNQDTSGTNTTVTLYLDGTQVGQKTAQTLVNVSSSNTGDEDQFMFGALFHFYSNGHIDIPMNGYTMQAGVASGNGIAPTWVSNLASLTANPYQMLHR